MAVETISEQRCFGGMQGFYKHESAETGGPMKFGVFRPPQAEKRKVPVLYYLAGLTCTEETFVIKAGAMPNVVMSAKEVGDLAKMPSRDELIAMLMGTMKAPIAKFVRTLNEVPGKFVRTVAAVRDEKQKQAA